MKIPSFFAALGLAALVPLQPAPRLELELVFLFEHWHNHASMIVAAPNGDLLVCWFHGSGERARRVTQQDAWFARRSSTRTSTRPGFARGCDSRLRW
jgi:hypothetical protein